MGILFLILKYVVLYGPSAVSLIKEILGLIKQIKEPEKKKAALDKLRRASKDKTVSKAQKRATLVNLRDQLLNDDC